MTTREKVVLLMMVLAVAVVLGGCPVSSVGGGARVGPHSYYISYLVLKNGTMKNFKRPLDFGSSDHI